jgi:hypothetical protein
LKIVTKISEFKYYIFINIKLKYLMLFNNTNNNGGNVQQWRANIANKKKLTESDARFYFEQAEKFLLDLIEAHKTIVDRTNTLLGLLITILTALIGYTITKIEDGFGNDHVRDAVIVLIVYLILGGIYLITNISPTNYMASGSQPKSIFTDYFFKESIPKEDRIIRLLSSEIERYQYKIQVNGEINNKKWKIYRNGIYILTAVPLVFLISYFIAII